ncbi:hypothetical protein DFH09DRAFT_1286440, partial [Mycena vulgaris]
MPMPPNSTPHLPQLQPIALRFNSDIIHRPGETLEGYVDMNLALMGKEPIGQVRIEFRGTVETYVASRWSHEIILNSRIGGWHTGTGSKQPGFKQTGSSSRSKVLWNNTESTEPNPSGIIQRKFRCKLPEILPPSFHFNCFDIHADVKYSIEVLGIRSGMGLRNKTLHINRTFTVFPALIPPQLSGNADLRAGWGGPWRIISHEQKMRRGMFGSRANVKIPDLPSLPRDTPFPLIFSIETRTKLMARGEPPEDEAMFPAPPTRSDDVALKIHHTVRMRGEYATYTSSNQYPVCGGLGDPERTKAVKCTILAPEWIAEPGHKKDYGMWKRVVHFESMVSVSETPTFNWEVEGKAFDLAPLRNDPLSKLGLKLDVGLEAPVDGFMRQGSVLSATFVARNFSIRCRARLLPREVWRTTTCGFSPDESENVRESTARDQIVDEPFEESSSATEISQRARGEVQPEEAERRKGARKAGAFGFCDQAWGFGFECKLLGFGSSIDSSEKSLGKSIKANTKQGPSVVMPSVQLAVTKRRNFHYGFDYAPKVAPPVTRPRKIAFRANRTQAQHQTLMKVDIMSLTCTSVLNNCRELPWLVVESAARVRAVGDLESQITAILKTIDTSFSSKVRAGGSKLQVNCGQNFLKQSHLEPAHARPNFARKPRLSIVFEIAVIPGLRTRFIGGVRRLYSPVSWPTAWKIKPSTVHAIRVVRAELLTSSSFPVLKPKM